MKRKLAWMAGLCLGAAALAAWLFVFSGNRFSKVDYDQIELGMTATDVRQILGEPGEIPGDRIQIPQFEQPIYAETSGRMFSEDELRTGTRCYGLGQRRMIVLGFDAQNRVAMKTWIKLPPTMFERFREQLGW